MTIVGAWHTGFQVADLERSLAFYCGLLGLEEIWRRVVTDEYIATLVGYPGVELHQALLRIPGSEHCLELLEYRNVERTPVDTRTANPGTAHLCLMVDRLAELYDQLLDAGVTFVSAPVIPTTGPNKGRLVAYLCDRDGIRLEVLQSQPATDADIALITSRANVPA
jgi:catechol 2,3-dioxygenase-like lactoylglutathione lyase family enzyme